MHWHRLYKNAAYRTALMMLVAACAGCWEEIEYTGPRTVSAPRRDAARPEEPEDKAPAKRPPTNVADVPPVAAPRNETTASTSLPETPAAPAPDAAPAKAEGDRYAAQAAAEPSTPTTATAVVGQTPSAMNSRRAAWQLGSRLSLAALANDRRLAADKVPIWLEDARTASRHLGTTVADLPDPAAADDNSRVSRQVVNFLLVDGQRIGRELSTRHGPEQSALFEIALKSNILLLLYSPGGTAGTSVAAAISQAAPQAKLPAEYWQPLVDALGDDAPHDDVRAAIRKMHLEVDKYLAQAAEQNGK
jgi:hypothetical protein